MGWVRAGCVVFVDKGGGGEKYVYFCDCVCGEVVSARDESACMYKESEEGGTEWEGGVMEMG